LSSTGLDFDVVDPDIDETPRPGEAPADYVERLACEKASAVAAVVAADGSTAVLAADTTVALDGCIMGKPSDEDEARDMLRALSGRTHDVFSGVAVRLDGAVRSRVEITRVTMADIAAADLDWYVATGEPMDKAGAYALQGSGALFVRAVDGSVSNVVGLPLNAVAALLEAAGWPLHELRGTAADDARR
jgi:septum formation protein